MPNELSPQEGPGRAIAVVGAGLRFPGGVVDLDSYWRLLEAGVDAVGEVPADRWDVDRWSSEDPDAIGRTVVRQGAFLDDVGGFDAAFFGVPAAEAVEMDPAQRLLLECAWEALEHAAIAPDGLTGSRTGVYVGLGLSDYGRRHFFGPDPKRLTPWSGTGSFLSVAAGRISYTLGLQGPALTVDTACSSSLVSVHLAASALRSGEVDLALAGGANLLLAPEPTLYFSRLGALAPDGRCKAFSAAADGYGRGEGVGVVVLKRLSDALADGDRILGVIRGSAVNQDGRSNGLTAPSGRAQQAVVRQALEDAGVNPQDVAYVEAHGTGTPLGDPVEIDALRAVYAVERAHPLLVGSVKTNLGHTETAAGVAGLLKALLVLQRGQVPPHLHLDRPNPRVRLDDRLQIPASGVPLPEGLAGVSSFGLSGTNAHLILQAAPATSETPRPSRAPAVLTLSARSPEALAELARLTAERLPDRLADASYTLRVGRASLPLRAVVVARDADQARERLGALADDPVIGEVSGGLPPEHVWLFTGQGAQHPGMGRRLYETEPAFREALDRCARAFAPELDLHAVLASEPIHQTRYTQPALFALQIALAALWRDRGVEPDILLGHSVGELAAACVAGVFSVEDGCRLVAARGRLMGEQPGGGGMVAIRADEAVVTGILDQVCPGELDLAAVNAPDETVVSGPVELLERLAASLALRGIDHRQLTVSHAFHSRLMDGMLDAFEDVARSIPMKPPEIPVFLDGEEAGEQLCDPRWWREQVRRPVRFLDGLKGLIRRRPSVFLELGPRPVLSGLGARIWPEARYLPSLHPDQDDLERVAETTGLLWAHGVPVDRLPIAPRARKVDLPTYPFQRQRYWLDPVASVDRDQELVAALTWEDAAPGPAVAGRYRVIGGGPLADRLQAELTGRGLVEEPATDVIYVAGGAAAEAAKEALALAQEAIEEGTRLHLVAGPEHAALGGLARVLRLEHPDRAGGFLEVHREDGLTTAVLAGHPWARLDATYQIARLVPGRPLLTEPLVVRGTWLVTGAFGALGQRVSRWLRERGAELVLVGRHVGSEALVQALQARAVAVDVSDGDAVQALVDGLPDLRGVVHLAGIVDDGPLEALTAERLDGVLAGKLVGARHLDEATRDRTLDAFVLFGSAAGWLGVPGQGAYAAANAGLHAIAAARRREGLPATCVAWGPWTEGLAQQVPEAARQRWSRGGVGRIDPPDALRLLGRAPSADFLAGAFDWARLAASRPHDPWLDGLRPAEVPRGEAASVARELQGLRPEARRSRLAELVQQVLVRILGRPVDPRQGLFDAGLDSLTAVELRNRLQVALDVSLSATLAFDHPHVDALVDHLLGVLLLDEPAVVAIPADRSRDPSEPIAIVGAAARLPGADDLTAFWDLLEGGVDAVTEVPPDRFHIDRYHDPAPGTPGRTVSRKGGFLREIRDFEPGFFGISPREATTLDPQQRLILEVAWEALEDAAVPPDTLEGTRAGVYVGIGASEYGRRFDPLQDSVVDTTSGTGNESSFAAGRLAYVLGARGPAMSVNTACSSALVAVHLAVRALRGGEADLALAGGVNVIAGPETTVAMSQLRALSPDGRCKAFDAAADGYVRGEGCGVVVLKRLSDAQRDGDRVLAVIRGSAVVHDGASSGLTVPHGAAQEEVIQAALADARVAPDEVQLVECHGTGTRLGDPVEVGALARVFGDRPPDRPLRIGSVKTQLGHLEAAAGIAGLLKVVLALRHGRIPPHLHLRTLNPELPRFPFEIPTEPVPWRAGPRRAGVSSFGISGTNAHVILEEAPGDEVVEAAAPGPALLTLSGHTPAAVKEGAGRLLAWLERDDPPLADVAATLNTGRAALPWRASVAVREETVGRMLARVRDGGEPIVQRESGLRLAFLCTGAGPQAPGMGRQLYDREPAFREALDRCAAVADPELDRPLLDVLFGESTGKNAPIHTLRYAQPALFAYTWAMAALWERWGVRPDAVIGHSTGQFVAATLAGVWSLEDGLRLLCRRAALMDGLPRVGAMAAILAPEAVVGPHVEGREDLALAAVNGPEEVVISGLAERVAALCDHFEAQGVEVRRLRISQAAHSPLMEPILDEWERLVAASSPGAPELPLVENVRGELAGEALTTASYWRDHLRRPVRFADGVRTLAGLGFRHFLEIGNHPVLSGAGARTLPEAAFFASGRRDVDEETQLLETAGRLWCAGIPVDRRALHASRPGRRIGLPTVAWQRRRCWVERTERVEGGRAGEGWLYQVVWEPVTGGAIDGAPRVVVDPEGILGAALGEALDGACVIPGSVRELDGPGDVVAIGVGVEEALALIQRAERENRRIWLVTRGSQQTGTEDVDPDAAPIWGLGQVARVELPHLDCVRVDLPLGETDPAGIIAALAAPGEDQLAWRDGRLLAPRLVPLRSAPDEASVRGAWWITGGLGALGLRVAGWLAEHGAEAVVLTSRSAPSEAVAASLPGRVEVIRGDVSDRAEVERILGQIRALGLDLRGVVHAAGILDDAPLVELDAARLTGVWGPKVDAARHLDQALEGVELDAFVLFSSAAALVGSAGQANYAAANAWLDALAARRRARGQPAVSLCWGPWAEEGLAAEARRLWTAGGVQPLPPRIAARVFGRLLGEVPARVGVLDVDWATFARTVLRRPLPLLSELVPDGILDGEPGWLPELRALTGRARRERLQERLAEVVAGVLGLEPAELDPRAGFFELGMDSLLAVEVANRLTDLVGTRLSATLCFDHPDLEHLTEHLLTVLELEGPVVAPAPTIAPDADELAVVGLSCRMPGGANDPEAFWRLLRDGVDPVTEVPAERWDLDALYDPTPGTPGRTYARHAAFLDAVDGFDPEFFGISPREAASMDPQQRLLLEVSVEALEQAGIPTRSLRETQTGVFVGVGDSGYLQRFQQPGEPLYRDTWAGTGNLSAFVAGRVAYALGLQGPNLALNTACSSSLVAVHLAAQALRSGECDVALAGGVHLMLSPENHVYVSQLRALSPDGRCKTFDRRADGYGRAEGCAVLVLKRLSDARRDGDPVLAVIRGTAVNHDGPSSGLTVPNGAAQQRVIRQALDRAGVDPADVSYLEAHGTGTLLGDPIEVGAARAVLCDGRPVDRPLHLGAVKSNVGHLEVAAGAASLAKVVLALGKGEIPPHLHFTEPNPELDLTGVVIDTAAAPWPRYDADTPRIAGVSGFGLSGTNAHVVLQEAPEPDPVALPDDLPPERPVHVLGISTRSPAALAALAERYLSVEGSLPDIAWSAHTRRDAWEHRAAIVVRDPDELRARLLDLATGREAAGLRVGTAGLRRPRVGFLFSGQGSQYPGMALALDAAHPVFRAALDRCAAVLDPLLGRPLRDLLAGGEVHDTTFTQPCLFAVSFALAELWASFGVRPDAVMGHSVGELVAATVAGVLDLPDALRLVAERGRLMGALPRDGAMLAVFAGPESLDGVLAEEAGQVGIAAVNQPDGTVISGLSDAVGRVARRLEDLGIEARPLTVSHAFHSACMDPVLDDFEAVARSVALRPPELPLISNLSGAVAGEEVTEPAYWRRHLREPVRFADGLRALEGLVDVVVEVGPHTSLLAMARQTAPRLATVGSLRRGEPDLERIAEGVGALWVQGVEVDWRGWDRPWRRRTVALPTYPWQRRRCWIDAEEWPGRRPVGEDWVVRLAWEALGGGASREVSGRWLILGNRGGLGGGLARLIEGQGAEVEVLELDHAPPSPDQLAQRVEGASGVVHLWSLDGALRTDDGPDAQLARGPVSALWLVQALAKLSAPPQVWLVTRGAVAVQDGADADPDQATLWGLGRVVRLEHPALRSVLVDLPADEPVEPEDLLAIVLAGDDEPEVALRDGLRRVPRLVQVASIPAPAAIRPDAAYLITGGLSGLGLEVARWLVEQGARYLVLNARSEPQEAALGVIRALEGAGARIRVAQGDVALSGDVKRVLSEVDALGVPLRGVVHAAGVLADGTVAELDRERFLAPFGPKMRGGLALHRATLGRQLDFLAFFGAGAALMGSPGQAGYAAANAWLAAFAAHLRARGLPAVCVDWGPWAEVGMAARTRGLAERQAREGIRPIPVGAGLELFGRLLAYPGAEVGVLPVDWRRFVEVVHQGRVPPVLRALLPTSPAPAPAPEVGPAPTLVEEGLPALLSALREVPRADWRPVVEQHVHDRALAILGLPPDRSLPREQPLLEVGLDSLLAVELKNALTDDGVDVPVARVMTGPSVAVLGELVLQALGDPPDASEADSLATAGGWVPVERLQGGSRPAEAPPVNLFVSHGLVALLTAAFIVGGYLLGQVIGQGTDVVEASVEAPADPPRKGRRR